MKTFIARHAALVTGVLSGFDRLVFRGTLLPLIRERGMHVFLSRAKVRSLDFKKFALRPSEQVREVVCRSASTWSAYQTEWASDVMFKSPQTLASIYPPLVHHAIEPFKSPDVRRFLGQKLHANFTGEVITSFKERPEGVRVKHWGRGNSVKMYDKAGRVLRVETTSARTTDFKVLRPQRDDDPEATLAWKPMRKGVADLHRRAEVSQRSNERYLDALAAGDDPTPCSHLFAAVARPGFEGGHRFRALRLGAPEDLALLQVISRGALVTAGFRNRDLRLHLSSRPTTAADQRRLSARVSRHLRLLRAHGVIRKVPKTHRYQLTHRGRLLTAAVRATRDASIQQLLREAA